VVFLRLTANISLPTTIEFLTLFRKYVVERVKTKLRCMAKKFFPYTSSETPFMDFVILKCFHKNGKIKKENPFPSALMFHFDKFCVCFLLTMKAKKSRN
jgi:hypothetical protein